MRTGRPATPIEQRKADGTLRAHHVKTPLLIGGRLSVPPRCPRWLSRDGKRAYGMLMRDLWPSGVLDVADTLLVVVAADALGDAMAAARDVKARGLTIDQTRITRTGESYTVEEKNPNAQLKSEALKRFHTACAELGIGPVARTRLAGSGGKGRNPAQTLPGVGAKPTKLRVVNGG